MGVASFVEFVLEKVERRREEMVDLHLLDWIIDGICGLGLVGGSISEMGWCWNWFLGLLHLTCSRPVVSSTTGMVSLSLFLSQYMSLPLRDEWIVRQRERESLCVFSLYV